MKKPLLMLFVAVLAWSVSDAQVRVAAKYNYPLLPGSATDSIRYGLNDIRGCSFDADVDGDGKSEIIVTNYRSTGRVHLFETVGNDSIALKWTSPPLGAATGSANVTPRVAIFGDLDNDGKKEIITQVGGQGIYIFEWDGVIGSDNYGTAYSQLIAAPFITLTTGNTEYMEALDIDQDGQQELLVAYNATANVDDKYYIFSAIGEWTTGDPGFSSFNVELAASRTQLPARYGLGGGSPVGMIAANFDGTGRKEILLHNWNRKNVTPLRVTAANTYLFADTSVDKQNIYLGGPNDDVSLFGGLATDIDGDGRDEVYLPTWYGSDTTRNTIGYVHMIFYDAGSNTSQIDSLTNTRIFNLRSVIGPPTSSVYNSNILGFGYGDVDGNGKKNLYFSGIRFATSGFNVVSMEFQGGDKRNPANWITSILYNGDSTIYSSIGMRDSLGRMDTIRTVWSAQVSKLYARNTDFDNDGKQDILLPFQGWFGPPDSTAINRLTWNAVAGRYDTVKSKIVNQKRWNFRIIERGGPSGVETKDLTVITPDDYRLEQNYPNPFNPSTTISFYLPIRDKISLKVYDLLGREVRTLISNEEYDRGTSKVVWDGRDNSGKVAATGTYFYTLKFGNFEKTNKMLLLK